MFKARRWFLLALLAGLLATTSTAWAQNRPYIGFVYPAGGQQGSSFQIKLGGQGLDEVQKVLVTGPGVASRAIKHFRKLNPQDMQLLSEQLRDLRRAAKGSGSASKSKNEMDGSGMDAMMMGSGPGGGSGIGKGESQITRLEKRMAEYVQRPASNSLADIVVAEVTIATDAQPGERELRLVTRRGVSNPLVFYVGQLPELCRKPMITSPFQVLGKEELALRRRPPEEIEDQVQVPCTVNGQVASGETNRYRFKATKGQRLVIAAQARQLIPYIADAVPGWFQPVLTLYNAQGKELAYDDDYRFKPDPILFFEVPKDGEYVFAIYDAIYRGREDFVYRISIGEVPFVTSVFPLGAQAGTSPAIKIRGWNVDPTAQLNLPGRDAAPGIYHIAAVQGKTSTNRVPFAIDDLPDGFDKESNNDISQAQKVKMPIIINGRIDRPDDWDVFQVSGRAGESIVAEVFARRLDSPLDSMLKVTDAKGKVLAFNDDQDDIGSGVNTHHADSYIMFKLPEAGDYFIHLGETDRHGGEEYAYRLRISPPRPDFALRVSPSSVGFRGKNSNSVNVYAIRKDGFTGSIKVTLKNPPQGFSAYPITMSEKQDMARLGLKTDLAGTKQPVTLVVEGRAQIQGRDVSHEAVPAEDRMQAFLWRHLVPARDLKAQVYDPSYDPPPKRILSIPIPSSETAKTASTSSGDKPKFTKQQVSGRLRQLKSLFEEGLLTEEFYAARVAECEAAR